METITWPAEFTELKELDALLKCGICYDYMKSCMMTSCCHNWTLGHLFVWGVDLRIFGGTDGDVVRAFDYHAIGPGFDSLRVCSLCIRKFMQYKTQCPTCFEETYENSLRNNRPLDQIVAAFKKVRGKLARAVRLAVVSVPASGGGVAVCPPPPPLDVPCTPDHKVVVPSSKRSATGGKGKAAGSQNKKKASSRHLFPTIDELPRQPAVITASMVEQLTSREPNDVVKVVPGMFLSPTKRADNPPGDSQARTKEMSECPVCSVNVPTRNINIHLDSCLERSKEDAKPKSDPDQTKREPMPKRLYNLMSDKELKRVLKECGLSTQGERKAMVARIQRFTVLYNSENDSIKPRPVSELLLQVEREEREEKNPNMIMKSFQARMAVDRKAPVDEIEKLNKKYIEDNKSSFEALIENMRRREGRNIRPLRPARRVESDDGEGESPRPSTSRCEEGVVTTDSGESSPEPGSREGGSRIDWDRTRCLEADSQSTEQKINTLIGADDTVLYSGVFSEGGDDAGGDSTSDSVFELTSSNKKRKAKAAEGNEVTGDPGDGQSSTPKGKLRRTPLGRRRRPAAGEDDVLGVHDGGDDVEMCSSPEMFSDQSSLSEVYESEMPKENGGHNFDDASKSGQESNVGDKGGGTPVAQEETTPGQNKRKKNSEDDLVDEGEDTTPRRSLRKRTKNTQRLGVEAWSWIGGRRPNFSILTVGLNAEDRVRAPKTFVKDTMQETTEIGVCDWSPFCDYNQRPWELAAKLAGFGLRNEGNCTFGVSETVGHVLLECGNYGDLRRKYVRKMGGLELNKMVEKKPPTGSTLRREIRWEQWSPSMSRGGFKGCLWENGALISVLEWNSGLGDFVNCRDIEIFVNSAVGDLPWSIQDDAEDFGLDLVTIRLFR
ncbi:hypothetical protein AAG570_005930 [Ranatra chinensis]|uniref:RING-type E3 ubiquitin transferase n=1 Tax=Ranatra chinensis TaxID=642074 RepID=A0ABD0YK93_9HEMI